MTEPHEGLPLPRRAFAILALSCGTALAVLDGAIVTVALPTMARELHVTPEAAVLVVTVYQLVLVMAILPLSALGSRIGLRRLYQAGQALFIAASVLCFFARSLPFLLAIRALQALGAAASLSVSSALIRFTYPLRRLGFGLGLNGIVVAAAGAAAPALGGLILSALSWPWLFAAAAPLALVSLFGGRRALPDPATVSEPYDVPGALLFAASIGLVIAGLEAGLHGAGRAMGTAITAAGALIGAGFVRRELGARHPILPVDLLRQPVLGLSALGGLVAFVASMTVMLSMPFRLETHFGFTPREVGGVLIAWPLSLMVVGPVSGWLSDRIPAAVLGAVGMAVAVAALVLLARLPAGASHAAVAWRLALCGSGFGLFLAPNARMIVQSAPPARAPSAGGLVSTTRLVGQTLGATLLAALLAAGAGSTATPAYTAAVLAAVAGLCGVARLGRSARAARASDGAESARRGEV